jgi:hypothetical protein
LLSLLFNPNDPFDQQVVGAQQYALTPAGAVEVGQVTDQAWLRFRIHNKRGRVAAEDVQVHVTDVRELEPRTCAPPSTIRSPGGLPLIWSNTDNLTTGLVPPGAEKPIDFAFLDRSAAESGNAALALTVWPKPSDNRHMLTSLRVEADLTITARNADPRDYRLRACRDGEWGDNPWEHVFIESLSLVRVTRIRAFIERLRLGRAKG